MSDVHNDCKDYGCSNYTVYARIDGASDGDSATVRQMENSFEAQVEMEKETTTS